MHINHASSNIEQANKTAASCAIKIKHIQEIYIQQETRVVGKEDHCAFNLT